ncbi:uncharacterized protein MKZ38_005406 [Zalerion maritima]|uniref:Uncharacterized protein n=1 Tax=Zalerion maritima TaxID=339359 RepID=A0AAD5WR06_9PEZI|nr:uncharacterized protein MKZ38_005406 [Zalerion maritima]
MNALPTMSVSASGGGNNVPLPPCPYLQAQAQAKSFEYILPQAAPIGASQILATHARIVAGWKWLAAAKKCSCSHPQNFEHPNDVLSRLSEVLEGPEDILNVGIATFRSLVLNNVPRDLASVFALVALSCTMETLFLQSTGMSGQNAALAGLPQWAEWKESIVLEQEKAAFDYLARSLWPPSHTQSTQHTASSHNYPPTPFDADFQQDPLTLHTNRDFLYQIGPEHRFCFQSSHDASNFGVWIFLLLLPVILSTNTVATKVIVEQC